MLPYYIVNFDLKIGPHGEKYPPAVYFWQHFVDDTSTAKITLHNEKCPGCGEFLFDADEYVHVLDHEFTELAIVETLFHDDKIKEFDPKTFNHLFHDVHAHRIKHECNNWVLERCIG